MPNQCTLRNLARDPALTRNLTNVFAKMRTRKHTEKTYRKHFRSYTSEFKATSIFLTHGHACWLEVEV